MVELEPLSQAEAFIAATGAWIEHGDNRAFYHPSTDCIRLPKRKFFVGTSTSSPADSYYSTLLHELTHWTSHKDRCNRQLGKRFGDEAYAMEELVAEFGGCFPVRQPSHHGHPSRRSCSVYRKLASRFESRQESDLHGGFQGFAGRRFFNQAARQVRYPAHARH